MSSLPDLHPGRLWSLLDMLTFFARPFVLLGEKIHDLRAMYVFAGVDPIEPSDMNDVQNLLTDMLKICDKLGMPVAKELIESAKEDPPRSDREFDLLTKAIYADIGNKLMVFVPSHRRKYFEPKSFIDASVVRAFQTPYAELEKAGESHAVGLFTASVFHAMRAVEVGLKAIAQKLEVELPYSLENADWETVIRQIESKVQKMKDLPKTDGKADMLHFYSEACMQFRYFKDGWRVRVAHSKATYEESQSQTVLDHAADFFKTLSTKLSEP